MNPIKSKLVTQQAEVPPRPTTLWGRIADGVMCESCRRYRRGLALVLAIALLLWLSGRWA